MSETLLIIHILAAATWIGGSLLLAFAGPRMARAGGPVAGAWINVVLQAVPRFFVPAALLTLISGLGLVSADDQWDWSNAFIGIGIAAVIIALAIALFNNVPAMKAILLAAPSGDMETVSANARKVVVGGSTISLILILTVIAMVLRLGVG